MPREKGRERLRELIERRGYGVRQLASLLHVKPSTLSRWLSGTHEKVPASVIPSLAVILDVPIVAVVDALNPIEDILERYELPVSLGDPLRLEATHAGEPTWLEDVTEAILIFDCLAPTDTERRRRLRTLSNLTGAAAYAEELLNVYMHHGLDHYFMRLLEELRIADPSRWEEFCTNLWRLVHIAQRDDQDDAFRYRTLQNALCYLIGFSAPPSREYALLEAEKLWRSELASPGTIYVARDTFYAAGYAKQPRAQDLVEEMIAAALSDTSPLAQPAQRAIVGCEALYYAPSLGRRSAFQQELVPEISRLTPATASQVLEGSIDHLVAPLPDLFLAYCAAIFLLWIRERGPRLEDDLAANPALRQKVGQFLDRADPSFRSRPFREVWSVTRAVVARLQRDFHARSEPNRN